MYPYQVLGWAILVCRSTLHPISCATGAFGGSVLCAQATLRVSYAFLGICSTFVHILYAAVRFFDIHGITIAAVCLCRSSVEVQRKISLYNQVVFNESHTDLVGPISDAVGIVIPVPGAWVFNLLRPGHFESKLCLSRSHMRPPVSCYCIFRFRIHNCNYLQVSASS